GGGMELSAGLVAVLGVDAGHAVTPSLLRATIRGAVGLAEASSTAAIARQVIAGMSATKIAAMTAVLAFGLLVAGAGAVLTFAAGGPPDDKMPAPAKQTPQAVAAADANAFTVAGQVLGPDGKPVAGAKLFVCGDQG